MRGWLSLALVCAAACSPDVPIANDGPKPNIDADIPADDKDGARSGSRLKLTWYQFADGTRQWDGFYDAQRKETCYVYNNWVDGKAYCAPDYGGSMVYADGGCTQRITEVYRDGCGRPAPPYALEYSSTPCDSRPAKLFLRGARVNLAQYYYKNNDGTCSGPYDVFTSYDYYSVGAEVQPSELVEVATGAPIGPGRLGIRYYESPDGMRLPASVHDAVLGTDCYPRTNVPGAASGSCAPSARYVSYEQDAACTVPKLSVSKQCVQPKYAVYYPLNACPTAPPEYYVVGSAVSGTPLYSHNGASCVASTPSTANNYYRMGEALSLAEVQRTVDPTGQRVQLVRYTNADGLKYRSYNLYDAQRGADCYPTKLPDGTIRCVVYGGYVRTLYRDAACTLTIDLVEVEVGPPNCGEPTVPKYARKSITPAAGSCTYGTQVYPITTPYSGPVYRLSGTCQLYTPTNERFYSLGTQVPLTDFVTASITTDP